MAGDFPGSKAQIVDEIFKAGVVGEGGAGFPTHIKARARADVVIANGCECEPLIQTDRYALAAHIDEILGGLRVMMLATGAGRGYLAVREGFGGMLDSLAAKVNALKGLELRVVDDNYPSGDEHILVYEVTGRAIPQGGIPPDVGVVVSNVNTLIAVRRSLEGAPVTSRLVSVCGDVARPCVVEVPIGTTVSRVLDLTGNLEGIEAKGVLISGVMMGVICRDMDTPIDKRVGSVVVLPLDSDVIMRKSLSVEAIVKRAASVCCQCTLCTELCPRHLMGHDITPHRIMRAICWSHTFHPDLAGALFCSGCGLCGVYVCPMLLSPDRISFMVRAEMSAKGVGFERGAAVRVPPVRPYRRVPHRRIAERTGLVPYERELEFRGRIEPEEVRIPLRQHVGVAARALVRPGDSVSRGDAVGSVEAGDVGAWVHASIDGVVVDVNHQVVIRKR